MHRHLSDPTLKPRLVRPLFDVVAPSYDRFTRLFSFGMDRRWKALLLREAAAALPPSGGTVLDLACGTGDLALGVAGRMSRGGTVLGVDASRRMLALARARVHAGRAPCTVLLCEGDMGALPLADGSVDLVTAGYAVRNASDPERAVREIARVLRPGGVMLGLDFFRPERALWRRCFLGYLAVAGRLVGRWWHREPMVYGYLAASIEHFRSWSEYAALLAAHGLVVERAHRRLLGGIVIHRVRRESAASHNSATDRFPRESAGPSMRALTRSGEKNAARESARAYSADSADAPAPSAIT